MSTRIPDQNPQGILAVQGRFSISNLETRRALRLMAVSGLGLLLCMALIGLLQPPDSAAAFVSGTARTWPGAAPCNTSLQSCIDNSASGDVINITSGVHFTGATLNKAVSLIGAGAGSTTLQALSNQRVLTVTAAMNSSTLISNLTIQGGNAGAANGGGIFLAPGAQPAIQDVVVNANFGRSGGGIYASGPITLTHVSLTNNLATNGSGAGLYATGNVVAADCTIQFNTVITNGYGGGILTTANLTGTNLDFIGNAVHNGYDGGGLYVSGALTLTGGQFTDNRTTKPKGYGGGGGLIVFGKTSITGTQFKGNRSSDWGGGAYIAYFANTVPSSLTNVQFISNTAQSGGGGGLFMWFASTLSNVDFLSNTASYAGGGAYAGYAGNYSTTIQGGQFISNTAKAMGGGLYSDSDLSITGAQFVRNAAQGNGVLGGGAVAALNSIRASNSQFSSNLARSSPGGALSTSQGLLLFQSTFSNNIAGSSDGGAAFARNGATLDRVSFADNQSAVRGGALTISGTLAISRTLFINNSAVQGGGLYQYTGGGQIVNALFSRNAASSTNGLDLYLAPSGALQILFTTIAAPIPAAGDAVHIAGGIVTIEDTIITNHTTGIYRQSGAVTQDYNLFNSLTSPTFGAISGGAHTLNGDPQFANPAGDDYHLKPGSPAADAGVDAGVAVDIDGQARPQNAGFDLGYDESGWLLYLATILR
jgi:predicted outer membrane repeat protein